MVNPHTFGIDEDGNFVAINLRLLCKGVTPYKIVSFKEYGNVVIS